MGDVVKLPADHEQRMAVFDRLLLWVLPRLRPDCDPETIAEMIDATISDAHTRGIEDSAVFVERLAGVRPSHDLNVAAKGLKDWAALNRKTAADPTPPGSE